MFKLIIAGGRDFNDYHAMKSAFAEFTEFTPDNTITIISGMAKGADTLGVRLAHEYNLELIQKPADWDRYGKSAGYRRNEEMAKIATHLLVAWDGQSKGTGHMIDLANEYHLIIKEINYDYSNSHA